MKTILLRAITAEHERRGKAPAPRRQRRGGPARGKVDYSSPEHAGEPHRGRITDAEKAYVREQLEAVNARLRAAGLREIDRTMQRCATATDWARCRSDNGCGEGMHPMTAMRPSPPLQARRQIAEGHVAQVDVTTQRRRCVLTRSHVSCSSLPVVGSAVGVWVSSAIEVSLR
jgi:hypothetical protein